MSSKAVRSSGHRHRPPALTNTVQRHPRLRHSVCVTSSASLRRSTCACVSAVCRPCVGRTSAVCRPCVGRVSAVRRPCVGRVSAVCRPCVGRVSAVCRPCVGRVSAVCRPCVGHVSAACRPCVGRVSAVCRPCVGRVSARLFACVSLCVPVSMSVLCARVRLRLRLSPLALPSAGPSDAHHVNDVLSLRMTYLGHWFSYCEDLMAITMCTKVSEIKFRLI